MYHQLISENGDLIQKVYDQLKGALNNLTNFHKKLTQTVGLAFTDFENSFENLIQQIQELFPCHQRKLF